MCDPRSAASPHYRFESCYPAARGDRSRGPFHGEPHRSRARFYCVPRAGNADQTLSDLDRVAAGGGRPASARKRLSRLGSTSILSVRRCSHRRRHRAIDYTKGIRAVDDFLSCHPEWIGRFVFIQATAPTRSKLASYSSLQAETEQLVAEINGRHGKGDLQPIRLVARHHEPDEVFELFRASDMCIVSSRHDGMNSGCQGIRWRTRRRAWRADPLKLRRSLPRTVGGADCQSI